MATLFKKTRLSLGIIAVVTLSVLVAYLLPSTPLSTSLIGQIITNWPENKLHVRVSRSVVQPGEGYILYAGKYQGTTLSTYDGLLDYRLITCDTQASSCGNPTEGQWGSYVLQNGQVEVVLPSNMPLGVYRASFRPRGKTDWEWSNPVVVNVGTTAGLEDMSRYWLLNQEDDFVGRNNVTGTTTRARIGYRSETSQCSWMPPGTKTMLFAKDHRDGYWSPNYGLRPWQDGRYNLAWYVAPWDRQPGWHDEYLTAMGHEIVPFTRPTDPQSLSFTDNFSTRQSPLRYGSTDPRFPGYVLSPRWAGPGWGMSNAGQTYGTVPENSTGMCNASPQGAGTAGWSVHIDRVDLQLPRYSGPAIRIKYFEFMPTWDFAIVENWYFVKNRGLARIEQKIYTLGQTGSMDIGRCEEDPDCAVNSTMSNPMGELTLAEYAAPGLGTMPPTPTATAIATTTPSPTALPTPTPTPTPSPTPIPTLPICAKPGERCISNDFCCSGVCRKAEGKILGSCR